MVKKGFFICLRVNADSNKVELWQVIPIGPIVAIWMQMNMIFY